MGIGPWEQKPCQFFTKNTSKNGRGRGHNSARSPRFEHFEPFSGGGLPIFPGDVTCIILIMNGFMHWFVYSYTWACGGYFPEIPVENRNFSTISTDFSTTVFHKWYSGAVDIIYYSGIRRLSYFFTWKQNHQFDKTGGKKRSWQTTKAVHGRKVKKFCKKVLIFWKKAL